jgi:diguanylate cyclase (GGDEF)-like protein
MAFDVATVPASLDVGTLFFVAICVTVLLGLFLLFAWTQERMQALAWWGAAYLVGGFSGVIWHFGDLATGSLPSTIATIPLYLAAGMIWSGARVFHGQPVRWTAALFGPAFWFAATFSPAFSASAASRLVLSSLIVAAYTFLTAAELRRERRKSFLRRWPAIFVPMLHGAIFLFPVALATLWPDGEGAHALARGWIVVFAIEVLLYAVGTAFIVIILAKDRTVHIYRVAAATDPLTGLLNRRGFFEAATELVSTSRRDDMAPVSVLAFDLDHFKSINDRYGHAIGDDILQLFAGVVRETLRATDIVGRLGGEEFVALLPGTLAEATVAAERVRAALAASDLVRNDQRIAATVSIGVACGPPTEGVVDVLLGSADCALYRAKAAGRNRVEAAEDGAIYLPKVPRQGSRKGWRRKRSNETGAANDGAREGSAAEAALRGY